MNNTVCVTERNVPHTAVFAVEEASARLAAGDVRTLSRAMSLIENRDPLGIALLEQSFGRGVEPWVIGITGVGGAGKSSLLPLLAQRLVERGEQVVILAIDPSSPFTGGALLGDRIRSVRDAPSDVMFRSLGSRGASGGVAACVADLARIAGAAGRSVVIIETVGAGQSEVAIRSVAHTVAMVTAPGLGDDIQAIKAGILEIATLVAVNKADRPDAVQAANQLRQALRLPAGRQALQEGANTLVEGGECWFPPVLEVSAAQETGIDALVGWLYAHRDYLARSGERERLARERARTRFIDAVRDALYVRERSRWEASGRWQKLAARVEQGALDPLAAVRELLDESESRMNIEGGTQ